MFSAVNKAMQVRFVELQQQNSCIGTVKRLMSAFQDGKQIQNYFDLEEKKYAIDERMLSNEKLRDDKNAKGEDVHEDDYAAACRELPPKRLDIETNIDDLLKSGDEGAYLRSLEDAEKRLADVRANAAVDKSCKNGMHHQGIRNLMTSKRKTVVSTRITAKI